MRARATFLIFSSVLAIAMGIFAVAALGSRADACGSTLGAIAQTATQSVAIGCTALRIFYYAGWVVLVLGVVFVILGALEVSRSPRAEVPPGWYQYRRGRWRWWDGTKWKGPSRKTAA